jgi:hypothetical protein
MVVVNDLKNFADKIQKRNFIFQNMYSVMACFEKIQFMIPWLKKKKLYREWHVNRCHINLGPHNIHVKKI